MTRTLRLVTYNLQRAIHYDRIREHFATLSPLRQADIVAVQEAQVPAGGPNPLARLAADLEGEYGWTYRTVMSYPGKEYGNGFLFRPSATPVADQVVALPRVDRLGWLAGLKTEGGVPDTKSAFAQVFAVGGRRGRVVSLHLDFAGGADHRVRQLTHLLGVLEGTVGTDGGVVDVLCGDFNTRDITDRRPPEPGRSACSTSRSRAGSSIAPPGCGGPATCSRASTMPTRHGDCWRSVARWGSSFGRSSTTCWSGERVRLRRPRWSPYPATYTCPGRTTCRWRLSC